MTYIVILEISSIVVITMDNLIPFGLIQPLGDNEFENLNFGEDDELLFDFDDDDVDLTEETLIDLNNDAFDSVVPENVFIDTTKKTTAHESKMAYVRHITPNADTISIEEFSTLLRNFRKKLGGPLAYGSIKCLFYTLYKHRLGDWDEVEMKRAKNTFYVHRENNISFTQEEEDKIKEMVKYFISYVFGQQEYICSKYIYVAIAVYLVMATNLRISELQQLEVRHLDDMINDNVLNIKIKKKKRGLKIVSNNTMIQKLKERITGLYENKYSKLIPVSKSYINKMIRRRVNLDDKTKLLGIQGIRKINTTILIQTLNLDVAQKFNRHTKSNVTFNYYNTRNYIPTAINTTLTKMYT